MDHKKVLRLLTNLVLVSNSPAISDERRVAANESVNYYALLIDSTDRGCTYSMLEESFKKHMKILRYDYAEYLLALKVDNSEQLNIFE